jgi:hypothetical protein
LNAAGHVSQFNVKLKLEAKNGPNFSQVNRSLYQVWTRFDLCDDALGRETIQARCHRTLREEPAPYHVVTL